MTSRHERAKRRDRSRAAGDPAPRGVVAPEARGAAGARFERPGWIGRLVVAATLAVLAFAPPASNLVWAVNGLRSVAPGIALAIVAVAALAAWLAVRGGGAGLGAVLGVVGAIVIAFPLRERMHLLGDTWIRLRTLGFQIDHVAAPMGFHDLAVAFHASPLDNLVDGWGVLGLARLGLPLTTAVSCLGVALALVYFAGGWRLAHDLAGAGPWRLPIALALVATGTLEAFAGYAEVGGLLAAVAMWWWALLLRPLARPRDALGLCAMWLVLYVAHRLALVMLAPLAWRAYGPALPGDQPGARRALVASGAATLALFGAFLFATGEWRRVFVDARELLATAQARGLRLARPSDILNSLALVAPLAFVVPWVAGRNALRDVGRRPLAALLLVGILPLALALAWLFPVGASGLGAHRDWDANLLLGIPLTLAATAVLVALPEARRRGALAFVLPVAIVVAGGWVAVNADERASEARAQALAFGSPALPDEQRGAVLAFLGYRASDQGDDARSAEYFDQAFAVHHNLGNALRAAESWVRAGDAAAARRSLAAARARGPLPPGLAANVATLEGMIAALEAAPRGGTASDSASSTPRR